MNPMAALCYLVAAAMALATGYVAYTRPPFPSDSLIIIVGIVTILVVLGYLLRRRR
jgi:LPXTG-motif cell wall-anchored protein